MLGVITPQRLAALRTAVRRPVTMAIVGTGGVSKSRLASVLVRGNTLQYRGFARDATCDPATETHDTSAARVILDLTLQLGVQVKLLVYQPADDYARVARALEAAGHAAPLVSLYQSYWGDADDIKLLTSGIARAPEALFISPYVEVGDRPTNSALQGACARLGGGGLANLLTAAPVARKAPGQLLTPRSGPTDSEVICLLAPSYYASGAGGTCPAGEVATACAAYVLAATPRPLTPPALADLLRCSSVCDRHALTSVPEYGTGAFAKLCAEIKRLGGAGGTGPVKLDVAGVLNLWEAYRLLAER